MIALVLLVALLIGAVDCPAQVTTGRSNTGAIVAPSKKQEVKEAGAPAWPLRFDIEFTEPSGNSVLDPKERGRMRVIITNIGRSMVRGVSVKVTAVENAAAVAFNEQIAVGDVPVESVRYAFFYFTAGPKILAPSATFKLQVLDSNGLEIAESKRYEIKTRAGS